MKRILYLGTALLFSALTFSSCMKEEKPYAIPPDPPQTGDYPVQNSQVGIGEDYVTQVYFSFSNGVVASNDFRSWDISFSTGADNSEIWMNGGKQVLIYPTGNADYAAVTTTGNVTAAAWKYDSPSGLSGKSGLGILGSGNHVGEVLIVDDGTKTYYKLQVLEAASDHYTIKTGPLAAVTGSEITLQKDGNYNYIFFSFTKGTLQVEPPKKDWDILFTRYRHVYVGYNPDGSDLLYLVNGVLTNPYNTESGEDSTKSYNFYDFTLQNAEAYTLYPDRDVIGFDWKTANINTGEYTVNAKAIFTVKDQNEGLWKLHFVSFYNSDGKKGYPQFEYQRLK